MAKVFIKTYGCTYNQADSDSMRLLLEASGHEIVEAENTADLVVLNSCAVKDATEQKILWKAAHTQKPLVVTGCLAQATPKRVEVVNPSASIIGTFAQHGIVKAVENALKGERVFSLKNEDSGGGGSGGRGLMHLDARVEGIIARIKVSVGCLGHCTFCETKLARGTLKSHDMASIKRVVGKAVAAGAVEVQLTSQDTGCFGFDLKPRTNLAALLCELNAIPGDFFIRVGMMNPEHALVQLDELATAFELPKVFKFLHLPIQSGSNAVLKHMKREYTKEDVRRVVKAFRARMPQITLATDLIVGYPTETNANFEESMDFVKEIGFDVVNVSKYSARPKTPAARLLQLPNGVIKERSEIASALCLEIASERSKAWSGWCGEVVFTEPCKARNAYYRTIVASGRVGEKKTLEITAVNGTSLFETNAPQPHGLNQFQGIKLRNNSK